MSLVLDTLSDKPVALFQMDDTTPLQDYSGYGVGATTTGTVVKHPSLAKGATYASVFSSAANGVFNCPVFRPGYEKDPFTLEAWVSPVPKTRGYSAQPVNTNLFTNPGFETRGASYTLYTNLATNPAPASATGYSAVNGSTTAYVPAENGIHVTVASGGVADAGVGFNGQLSSVVLGNGYRYSVEIEAVIACTVKISIQGSTVSGGSFNITPVSFNAGEKKRITTPSVAAIASGNTNAYVLRGSTAAAEFIVRRVMQIQTTNDIEYFDGVTKTGLWNDADYTVAWNGTAHASTSRINALLPVGATASSNAKAVSSAVWSAQGSASLRITGSPYSSADSYVNVPLFGIVQEGKTYTVLATLRQNAILTGTVAGPSQQRNIFVDINGGGGGSRALGLTTPQANAPGVYYHRLTFTVPQVDGSPVTSMNMRLYNGYYAGNEVWWDNIVLIEGTYNGNYFDGSMPGYEWTGAANASTSRSKVDVARINYATNPHPTAFTTGAATIGPRNSYWHGVYTIENTSPPPGFTTYARKTANDPNGGATFQFGVDSQDTPTVAVGNGMVVTAGDVMTTSAWVRYISTGYAGMNMKHTFYDNLGTRIAEQTIAPVPFPSNTWTRVSGTFTVPNNASRMQSRLEPKAGGVVGDSVDVTGLLFERSPTLNTYFDGSTIGAVWSGTQSASVSYMLLSDTDQQILSHAGADDGLVIHGTVVEFSTEYADGTAALCSYDLQTFRAFHVAGVHTADKNSLYIDGVMVSEVSLTESQKASAYLHSTTDLISGNTTGSAQVALNNVAFYAKALPGDVIARHFRTSRDVPDSQQVVETFAGDVIPVSLSNASIFLDQKWQSATDWTMAQLNNVAVVNDQLVPQFQSGVSVAGTWADSFDISAAGVTAIYGVSFNWDGEGASIQVSLDGTTWETVTRGALVSTIPAGFDPTGKTLQIRASFAGGITGDTSYLDNLSAVGLVSSTSPVVAGRTIAYASAYPERDFDTLRYDDNWGVEIASGGSITISADALEATPARTLELWLKSTNGSQPTITMTGTNYINGVADSSALVAGQWTLMHIVAASDVTTSIVITGPVQIGQVGIYDTALSAQNIADIYAAYVGTNSVRVTDTSTVAVTESPVAGSIYAHDWSIIGAG